MNRLCALSAIALPLLLAPNAAPRAADRFLAEPEVTLRLVDPAEPVLLLTNATPAEARGIDYRIKLWNLDKLTGAGADPQFVTDTVVALLGPRETSAPVTLFGSNIRASLKRGDRIVGAIGVTCTTCARGHSYRVYIVYGEGGWFSEFDRSIDGVLTLPSGHRGDASPDLLLTEALLAWIDKTPEASRIQIAPLLP